MASFTVRIKGMLKMMAATAIVAAACLGFIAACGKKGPPVPSKPFTANHTAPTGLTQTPSCLGEAVP